ncbi:MAG: L,D-transpeptidase/peptidoglycan binding protein [Actinobacteria bacterium]|nr:L,D-transpeptidase/peptidoglycan binding protein [Actinomycetota bacterium]
MRSVGIASRSAGWLGEKKLSRILLLLGGAILVVAVVGIFLFLLIQDMVAFGTFPRSISIVGVDVSGLSKTEALEKCRTDLAELANRPLSLKVDEDNYQASPQEIGLKLEYQTMVDEAYREAWNVNVFERMARRFINRPKTINVSLMAVTDDAKVNDFVNRALGSINRTPQDAYVDVTNGTAVIVPAKDGRQADQNQLLADTKEALGTPERTVNVQATMTPAAVNDSAFGRLLIINLSAHTISLYERDKLLAQYPVACGSPKFPTPIGQWKVILKERNPAWRNPGSAWAKSMPPYIPPGPGNPLGTRALTTNAGGILIHGTPSPWSVGRSVSHGCVRMYMKDVEQLFEMVEVNAPVYIIRAAGDPGFDVTKKPFWQK